MGDESPYPSAMAPATGKREEVRLSVALGDLLRSAEHIGRMLKPLFEEHRVACEQHARAEATHKRAEAEAYLKAEGPVEERKRKATLDPEVSNAFSDLCEAKMARRICEKAMKLREEELGVLTALAHAHNREIKVLEG